MSPKSNVDLAHVCKFLRNQSFSVSLGSDEIDRDFVKWHFTAIEKMKSAQAYSTSASRFTINAEVRNWVTDWRAVYGSDRL